MGSFKQLKSGNWQAQVYLGKDPETGKAMREYKTFTRKRDAKKWARKMELQADQGVVVQTDMTVKDLLLKWFEEYAVVQTEKTTHDRYEIILKTHLIPALGHIKLKELSPAHIRVYLQKKRKDGRKDGKEGGLSEATLLKHYKKLKQALSFAVRNRYIAANPADSVEAPKIDRRRNNTIVALTKEEISKLLEVAKEDDPLLHDFIYLAVHTGMRKSELLGLEWDNVDFENKKIRVRQALVGEKGNGSVLRESTKTANSNRNIDITDEIVEVLKKRKEKQKEFKEFLGDNYHDEYNLVFCKEDGEKYYPDRYNVRYAELRDKAGLDKEKTLHTLRHTHASILLQLNEHPKIVQERLGHASITQTMDTYSHLIPTLQAEAAEKASKFLDA